MSFIEKAIVSEDRVAKPFYRQLLGEGRGGCFPC